MSGPYCETCDYYRPTPSFGSDEHGECMDPSKIIYAGCGDRVNSEPEVFPRFECCNHTGLNNIEEN